MSRGNKQAAAYLAAENKKYTSAFVPLQFSKEQDSRRVSVFRSNRFLVQIFLEKMGIMRMTVNRTMIDVKTGHWIEGITWDEIQNIKSVLGFGKLDAVEVYPADDAVVNVANMRHIWIMPEKLPFVWRDGMVPSG